VNFRPGPLCFVDTDGCQGQIKVGLKQALSEEICSPYQRPIPSRPLLRPAQGNFAFHTTINLIERKNCISHLKVSVGRAEKADGITGKRKLMRCGFADWAMEYHGHSLPALSDKPRLATRDQTLPVSEIASSDNGPLPGLRSLPCLTQSKLLLFSIVLFSVPPSSASDLEVVTDYATESGCVDTWKLLRRRFANWANEGH
jgi:hypothetical protein